MNPEVAQVAHTGWESKPVDIGPILDEGRLSSYQRRVVALIALSIIIDGIDSQLLGIVIPGMMTEWAVPRSAFAPVLAAGFVGMMVGGAIAGVVGDRLGRRVALTGSVLMFGLMTVAASRIDSLFALGVLRFFIGIGLQGASPNAAALVAEYIPLRHRAFAITATIVCIPLGATVAGLIAIPVLPSLGWRGLFVIGGLLSIAISVSLMRFLPESPRYLARRPKRWPELVRILQRMGQEPTVGAGFVDLAETPVGPRAPMRAIFNSPVDTIALWSAFFFCLLAVYSGFNWIPSLLTGAGFDSTVANTGITAWNLGGVVGAVTGGLAIARFGSKPSMLAMSGGAVIGALVMRSMTISPTSPTLPIIGLLAIIGAFINAAQVTMYALAAHIYPSTVRATGVGTATSVGRIGAILSPYAGTWALELGGNRSFFTLVAAAMVAVFMSLAAIKRHIPGTLGARTTRVSPVG
jgi:MFS transporter, AAHS family, 4-hydroxybenzoate transporter